MTKRGKRFFTQAYMFNHSIGKFLNEHKIIKSGCFGAANQEDLSLRVKQQLTQLETKHVVSFFPTKLTDHTEMTSYDIAIFENTFLNTYFSTKENIQLKNAHEFIIEASFRMKKDGFLFIPESNNYEENSVLDVYTLNN